MSETVEQVTLQDRLRYCVADATPTERRRAELQAADTIDKLTSQLEEARAKAIEEAAQVAAISASASEDHGDDDGAFMAREIETGIRALIAGSTK
jgi:hypothetical protein